MTKDRLIAAIEAALVRQRAETPRLSVSDLATDLLPLFTPSTPSPAWEQEIEDRLQAISDTLTCVPVPIIQRNIATLRERFREAASAARAADASQIAELKRERDAANAHAREASMEERELRQQVAALSAQVEQQQDELNRQRHCDLCGLNHEPSTYHRNGKSGWAECHYRAELAQLRQQGAEKEKAAFKAGWDAVSTTGDGKNWDFSAGCDGATVQAAWEAWSGAEKEQEQQ